MKQEFPVLKFYREMERRPRRPRTYTAKELLRDYRAGKRIFDYAQLDGEAFVLSDLRGASFGNASMRGVNFGGALLNDCNFKSADLSGSSFRDAYAAGANFIWTKLRNACMRGAHLLRPCLSHTDLTNADLQFSSLRYAEMSHAELAGARLTGVKLDGTIFFDTDIRPLCAAKRISHYSPSSVDARTIIKSYSHPGLSQFLLDCGIPQVFVTYMIECARATSESSLQKLMQSTFISYGGPDERFVRRIYDALRASGVTAFFFPETARIGARISNEVYEQIQRHDRVLLVCSKSSLNRPGVIHEIQETLDREARDGGATYLLPIMLDQYVLRGWRAMHPSLSERIRSRVIADFKGARNDAATFDAAMNRVIDALRTETPLS